MFPTIIKEEVIIKEEDYQEIEHVDTIEVAIKQEPEDVQMENKNVEQLDNSMVGEIQKLLFPCEVCGKKLTSLLQIEDHRKRCKGGQTALITGYPDDLNSFAKVVNGKKTFWCHICEYKTTNSGHMNNHLATHSNIKPHVCDICSKGFARDSNLIRHKLTHSGEKPYRRSECAFSCPQCSYTTSASSSIKRHTRTHTGERPFACSLCEYKGNERSDLSKHIKWKHSTDRPYTCPHCEYKAVIKDKLVRHIKNIHLK